MGTWRTTGKINKIFDVLHCKGNYIYPIRYSLNNNNMEIITLTHGKSEGTTCEIYKYGATVTSWRVAGGENIIFVSKKAKLDGTKAIRGGIPVCFPQFGPWEFGAQHGFARISH